MKFFSVVKKYINNAKNANLEHEIRLTDERVITKDFQSYSEVNWSVFTSFIHYGNYLLLCQQDYVVSAMVIDTNKLDPHQKDELLDFVKSKLPEKKTSLF
jgi:hypothetical protein